MSLFGALWNHLRLALVPFLVLAYPVVFLQFQGGDYCGPLCFEPTVRGVTVVIGALAVLALVAAWLVTRIGGESEGSSRASGGDGGGDIFAKWLAPPTPLASAILLAVFIVFVGMLALDSMTIAEAVWKPIVLPLSFFVFLPVWVLYVATFPLAIVFSLLGIDSPQAFTLLLRAIVIFVGFPLSALLQVRALSALTGLRRSKNR